MNRDTEHEMDDWTFDEEAMLYRNRWDKSINISAQKIKNVPMLPGELNKRLNAIALSIQKKRKRERGR